MSPLMQRAWTLQERLTAPRIIHFHESEMIYECTDSTTCECGGLDLLFLDPMHRNGARK